MDDGTGRAEVVARRFCAGGPVRRVDRHREGHIHDTWFVTAGSTGFVLQRLNAVVFPDCVQLMANVMRVTAHLARRGRDRVAAVLASDDGALLVYDADGHPWRAFERVAGASAPASVESPEVAGQVGRALGRFFATVQGLPGPPLVELIPGFKDFLRRKDDFEFMVDLDPVGRAAGCRQEIEDVRHFHHLVKTITIEQMRGGLPARIAHNDAKAANVLLDDTSGAAAAVVDLDTVGPGTVLYDVGDLLRSTAVPGPEDGAPVRERARAAGAPGLRDDLLTAALGGWLAEAGDLLTPAERDLLPIAGPLMAYECAIRFLADHLAGDVYFRVDRPGHNLDRARTQHRVLRALWDAGDRVAQLARTGGP